MRAERLAESQVVAGRIGWIGKTSPARPGTCPASLRQGHSAQHFALTVAAWICCMAPPTGFMPGPVADAYSVRIDAAQPIGERGGLTGHWSIRLGLGRRSAIGTYSRSR